MSKIFARFLKDESGATTLGTQLNSVFDTSADKLGDAVSAVP